MADPQTTAEVKRIERQVNEVARLMNATFRLDPTKLANVKELNRAE